MNVTYNQLGLIILFLFAAAVAALLIRLLWQAGVLLRHLSGTFREIREPLEKAIKDLPRISSNLADVSENITILTDDAIDAVETLREHQELIDDAIRGFSDIINLVTDTAFEVHGRLTSGARGLLGAISAIVAFVDRKRKRKRAGVDGTKPAADGMPSAGAKPAVGGSPDADALGGGARGAKALGAPGGSNGSDGLDGQGGPDSLGDSEPPIAPGAPDAPGAYAAPVAPDDTDPLDPHAAGAADGASSFAGGSAAKGKNKNGANGKNGKNGKRPKQARRLTEAERQARSERLAARVASRRVAYGRGWGADGGEKSARRQGRRESGARRRETIREDGRSKSIHIDIR